MRMSPPPSSRNNVRSGCPPRSRPLRGFLTGPFFGFACVVVSFPGPPISCAFLFGLLKKTGWMQPARKQSAMVFSIPCAGHSAWCVNMAAEAGLDFFILGCAEPDGAILNRPEARLHPFDVAFFLLPSEPR